MRCRELCVVFESRGDAQCVRQPSQLYCLVPSLVIPATCDGAVSKGSAWRDSKGA